MRSRLDSVVTTLLSLKVLPILLITAFVMGVATSLSAHAEQPAEPARVIHDSIEADPQAEMKAPTATVEGGSEAGVSEPMVIIVNGRRYEIPSIYSVPDDLRGHYNKMSPEYQQMFHSNRVIFLTRAAQLLSTSLLGNMFGTGAIVKDRVQWSWDHLRGFVRPENNGRPKLPSNGWYDGRRVSPGVEADILAAIERQQIETQPTVEQQQLILKTFQERKQEVIQRILLNLDRSFFSRPALVANSNEVGVFGSLGATTFLGAEIKGKKWGLGGSYDIGIFVGWNKTDSSAVVQFFQLTEKFRGTMTALTGNAAIVPKWGMMFANVQPGSETAKERGAVHYPPTPPGVSSFYLASPQRFAVGMNPPVGLIPWPLDSILIYSMDYTMKPLMRIALRFEVLKDFIKVDTGPKGEVRGTVRSTVRRSVLWVQSKALGRSMCVGLHAQ